MTKAYRIVDRFRIPGHCTIYMIKNDSSTNLQIDDTLYDLKGHRFKVKAFEMVNRLPVEASIANNPIGITLQSFDGCEVCGQMLVDSIESVNFLFCNHPLKQNCVDEDYTDEYQAAGNQHSCALFSYEDMEHGKLSLYGDSISGLTVYRGWMMKPEMYRDFYRLLEAKGIILVNSPEEYARYHLLPGWYREFSNETAFSVWEEHGNPDSVMENAKNLAGSYIVKDFVKSRKHEWYDACFIPNIANTEDVKRVVKNFIERQGDSMTGGVVLRKFEKLKSIGFHEKSGMPISEEYRVFVFAGNILCLDDYWEGDRIGTLSDEEIEWINSAAKRVQSNFVTIDVARKEDGSLIVMELGDGQVSGLQQMKAVDFYHNFKKNIES